MAKKVELEISRAALIDKINAIGGYCKDCKCLELSELEEDEDEDDEDRLDKDRHEEVGRRLDDDPGVDDRHRGCAAVGGAA